VVDFINELKSKGIKCAIGSASKNTPLILERIGLSSFFDAVVDGNTVTEAKPNPEVFLKGAEKLGIRPDECLVFEDAEAGVQAAKAGGMLCIGVGSPDILWMADAVIPGFEGYKLENALKQIRK
jgi:beta-phosphoglucomutase